LSREALKFKNSGACTLKGVCERRFALEDLKGASGPSKGCKRNVSCGIPFSGREKTWLVKVPRSLSLSLGLLERERG